MTEVTEGSSCKPEIQEMTAAAQQISKKALGQLLRDL